jgi:hypothetical protein
MKVKVGKYTYEKSDKKNKKLMTVVNNKTVHFGDIRYQHFKDKTGIWSKLDHGDQKRRKNYLNRAGGIRNKAGKLTSQDPSSPNYHAIRILWAG